MKHKLPVDKQPSYDELKENHPAEINKVVKADDDLFKDFKWGNTHEWIKSNLDDVSTQPKFEEIFSESDANTNNPGQGDIYSADVVYDPDSSKISSKMEIKKVKNLTPSKKIAKK
jgi:hypothetical protein